MKESYLKNILVTGGVHQIIQDNHDQQLVMRLMAQTFGNFKAVELIHQSELSCVFIAARSDGAFEQQVVIKVLTTEDSTLLNELDFINEWKILARLNHRGIAQIHDASVTEDGYHFMIMEFIEGEAVDVFCDSQQMSIKQRLQVFLQVLEAVEYAHENMILHKDIKPSNIMVQANGDVKLLDFGIASFINDSNETPNTVIFTPGYASPEQINLSHINIRSDVYQLGLLLFKLLVGDQPFTNKELTLSELKSAINDKKRPAPSHFFQQQNKKWQQQSCTERQSNSTKLLKQLNPELDQIVLKCIDVNPDNRYNSVTQLQADIKNYLSHYPVSAMANKWVYRLKKSWTRNHKTFLFIAASLVAVLGFTGLYIHDIKQQKQKTLIEQQKTDYIAEYLINLLQNTDAQLDLPNQPSLNDLVMAASKQLIDQPKLDYEVNRELVIILANSLTRLQSHQQALDLLLSITSNQPYDLQTSGDFELYMSLARAYYDVGEVTTAGHIYDSLLDSDIYSLMPALEQGALYRYRAEVARKSNEFEQALAHVKTATNIHSSANIIGEKKQNELIQNYNLMGGIHINRQDFSAAKEAFAKATSLLREAGRDATIDYITISGNLAILYDMSKQPDKAESVLQKTINLLKTEFPQRHSLLASHTNTLANVRYQQGDFDQAIKLTSESIEIYEAHYGKDFHKLLSPRKNLVMFLSQSGQCEAAQIAYASLLTLKTALAMEHEDDPFDCDKPTHSQQLH